MKAHLSRGPATNSDSTPHGSVPATTVAHEENESKGRYAVRLDDAEAEMTYTRAGQHLIMVLLRFSGEHCALYAANLSN
jgi:hypothetical protein